MHLPQSVKKKDRLYYWEEDNEFIKLFFFQEDGDNIAGNQKRNNTYYT